jgi:Mg/Co/Ni transporter MgtE
MLLISLAVLRHEAWVGLLSGMLGAAICTHFLKTLFSKNIAIKTAVRVASYHHLL